MRFFVFLALWLPLSPAVAQSSGLSHKCTQVLQNNRLQLLDRTKSFIETTEQEQSMHVQMFGEGSTYMLISAKAYIGAVHVHNGLNKLSMERELTENETRALKKVCISKGQFLPLDFYHAKN